MTNVLSVDVEEYFHPAEVQAAVSARQWSRMTSLIEPQTRRVLDLLDAHNARATFFVLGWVAERHPSMLRQIAARGHEIACHSYAHRLVYELTPAQFRDDTARSVAAIEDACGVTPRVYRAPSYSITGSCLWALEILVALGFTHDSSVYPISHDRGGIPGFERRAHAIDTPSGPIMEVPIATARLGHSVIPVGGGGYLRLLPYRYTAAGIRRINRVEGRPACLYLHPWELDAGQPRIARGAVARLRTYTGLHTVTRKIERLLSDFAFSTLTAVFPAPSEVPMAVEVAAC